MYQSKLDTDLWRWAFLIRGNLMWVMFYSQSLVLGSKITCMWVYIWYCWWFSLFLLDRIFYSKIDNYVRNVSFYVLCTYFPNGTKAFQLDTRCGLLYIFWRILLDFSDLVLPTGFFVFPSLTGKLKRLLVFRMITMVGLLLCGRSLWLDWF